MCETLAIGTTMLCARQRTVLTKTGRWTSRDPKPYSDGPNLNDYCRGRPLVMVDPAGAKLCALLGSGMRRMDGCDGGVALLISGRTGRLLYEFRSLTSDGIGSGFGQGVSQIGDVDGDGRPKLLIGAVWATVPGGRKGGGCGYVFSCHRVFLQANQVEYADGDLIAIDLRGGTPGVLGLIEVIDIDGVPTEIPLVVAPMDANGELNYSDLTDPTLAGLTVVSDLIAGTDRFLSFN